MCSTEKKGDEEVQFHLTKTTVVKRKGGDGGVGKVYRTSMEMEVMRRCKDHQRRRR